MDSAFIHQAANELVQNAGTRNIKQIARSCSLDISETSRIKDMLGLLSLYFDKPLILINRQAGQTDEADGVRLCTRTLSGTSTTYGPAYPEQVSDH